VRAISDDGSCAIDLILDESTRKKEIDYKKRSNRKRRKEKTCSKINQG
jgi:hypothetical protein